MSNMKKPQVTVEIPEPFQAAVNKLVRYYYEGWRAGYLEGFTKSGLAIIRPVGAIGGMRPNVTKVELDCVQLIESLSTVVIDGGFGVESPTVGELIDSGPCSGSAKYKGTRKPKCNGGHPCQACLDKYAEVHAEPKLELKAEEVRDVLTRMQAALREPKPEVVGVTRTLRGCRL